MLRREFRNGCVCGWQDVDTVSSGRHLTGTEARRRPQFFERLFGIGWPAGMRPLVPRPWKVAGEMASHYCVGDRGLYSATLASSDCWGRDDRGSAERATPGTRR
jgi:hypothetical protein